MTGKASARQGSRVSTSPSLKLRMWSWQQVVACARAVRAAVDDDPALAADPLAAVVVEGDRLLALEDQPLVDDVEHLQERHVGADVAGLVGHEPALGVPVLLPPDVEGQVHRRLGAVLCPSVFLRSVSW